MVAGIAARASYTHLRGRPAATRVTRRWRNIPHRLASIVPRPRDRHFPQGITAVITAAIAGIFSARGSVVSVLHRRVLAPKSRRIHLRKRVVVHIAISIEALGESHIWNSRIRR